MSYVTLRMTAFMNSQLVKLYPLLSLIEETLMNAYYVSKNWSPEIIKNCWNKKGRFPYVDKPLQKM
jgi:hypothetical protein